MGSVSRMHPSTIAWVCGLSVALGAFGAHALSDILQGRWLEIYKTSVQYHMFNGLGWLIASIWLRGLPQNQDSKYLKWTNVCFAFGILIFCVSLYLLSVTRLTWLGAITPIGGVLLLLAWLFFGLALRHAIK